MTRWFARMAAVAIAAFSLTGSAKADYVVDNFLNPVGDVWAISFTANFGPQNYRRIGDPVVVSGASRDLIQTVFSPNPAGPFDASGGIGANVGGFRFGNEPGVTGGAVLTYTWGAAQDLTQGGANSALSIHFVSADLAFPIVITASNGLNSLTYSTTVAAGNDFNVSTAFGLFAGTGSFSQISKLEVAFNYSATGTSALDLKIDNIRTTTNVPAPPALFLVGAALPVIGVRRWMARKKAVTAVA
jgi:hypothetical protein